MYLLPLSIALATSLYLIRLSDAQWLRRKFHLASSPTHLDGFSNDPWSKNCAPANQCRRRDLPFNENCWSHYSQDPSAPCASIASVVVVLVPEFAKIWIIFRRTLVYWLIAGSLHLAGNCQTTLASSLACLPESSAELYGWFEPVTSMKSHSFLWHQGVMFSHEQEF